MRDIQWFGGLFVLFGVVKKMYFSNLATPIKGYFEFRIWIFLPFNSDVK